MREKILFYFIRSVNIERETSKQALKILMEKSSDSFRSPMADISTNVATSTPLLQSEIGRKLIRRQFARNIPQDISWLEARTASLKIDEQPEPKLFIFKKEQSDSPVYKFHTPKTISHEMIEKFYKLFEETPKIKRRCIRL